MLSYTVQKKLLQGMLYIFKDLLPYTISGHKINDPVTPPLKRRASAMILLRGIRN
jgi:hypothetical protein